MPPLRSLLALLIAVAALPAHAAALDKFLPDDTDGLAVLNVRQVMASPLFKKHYLDLLQKTLRGNQTAQDQLQAIGIDPLKDIDRLLVVHAEGSHRLDPKPGGKAESGLYFVLRGKFDVGKIKARAAEIAKDSPKLLRIQKTSAGELYEFALEQPIFIAMPDATALVASPFRDQVTEALAKGTGKRKLQLKSKAMQKMIEAADTKQSLWLAGIGSMAYDFDTTVTVVKGKKVAKTVKETLVSAGVLSISGGVFVGDGIKTEIRVECPDEKTAKKISEYISQDVNQGIQRVFQASLKQKQFEPLGEYLRQLEAVPKGKTVLVRGEVTAKDFENASK